jgi:hypothetical protein
MHSPASIRFPTTSPTSRSSGLLRSGPSSIRTHSGGRSAAAATTTRTWRTFRSRGDARDLYLHDDRLHLLPWPPSAETSSGETVDLSHWIFIVESRRNTLRPRKEDHAVALEEVAISPQEAEGHDRNELYSVIRFTSGRQTTRLSSASAASIALRTLERRMERRIREVSARAEL